MDKRTLARACCSRPFVRFAGGGPLTICSTPKCYTSVMGRHGFSIVVASPHFGRSTATSTRGGNLPLCQGTGCFPIVPFAPLTTGSGANGVAKSAPRSDSTECARDFGKALDEKTSSAVVCIISLDHTHLKEGRRNAHQRRDRRPSGSRSNAVDWHQDQTRAGRKLCACWCG